MIISLYPVFLSILILFLGNIFLLSFQINNFLKLSLSWFAGCLVIVASYIVLIFLKLDITFLKIIISAFLISFSINIYLFKIFKNFSDIFNFLISKLKKMIKYIFFGSIIILITNYLIIIMVSTPDSLQYFAFSEMFHELVKQDYNQVNYLDWWFQSRLIFLVAIHNLAKLFGINLFSLFFSFNFNIFFN